MSDIVLVALITAVPPTLMAMAGLLVSWRNSKKLDVVHRTTNSLSERNEAIAKELGVQIGKATEKASPTP